MRSSLPMEVLGLVSPILSWVEGSERLRLPQHWLPDMPLHTREQAWLLRELPTYSYDNVDEILQLRNELVGGRGQGSRSSRERGLPAPPPEFSLSKMFERLGNRYFVWNGNELSAREGLLNELHELAVRFPVGHLIRFRHAEAVGSGLLSSERAFRQPEQLGLLHSTSYGLRTVINRGLSEGHMHLWGVTNAEDGWADQLLKHLTPGALEAVQAEERRLLILGRTAVRLLALGVLHEVLSLDGSSLPFELIFLLDEMYLARSRSEEWTAHRNLAEAFNALLCKAHGSAGGENKFVMSFAGSAQNLDPEILDWALRLAFPAAQRSREIRDRCRFGSGIPGEGIRERLRLLADLHLRVQLLLLRTPRYRPALQGASGDKTRFESSPLWEFLHQVFFRYIIYHTHHWQLATQHGKTTGLRQFRHYYGAHQRNPLRTQGPAVQGLIMDRLNQAQGVERVEGRVSLPEQGFDDLVPWILGYAQHAEKGIQAFGLILHFIKAERDQADDGRASHPGRRSVRYGRIRRLTQQTALRIFRLLSQPHPVVPFIVGIDAANLELTTPPEVFAPAFRFLREYPIEIRRQRNLDRFGGRSDILELVGDRRLGMTYHVGEDFRHLLSGLRAVAEVIEFLKPRPGDRLGHAIALALDPSVWAAQIGHQAVLPRLEWLDTLVWIHHFLGPGHDLIGELAIEDWIQKLSHDIYGSSDVLATGAEARHTDRDWSPLALYDAWRLRQLDPYSFSLNDLRNSDQEAPSRRSSRHSVQDRRWVRVQAQVLEEVRKEVGSNAAYHLLWLYWFSDKVREKGDKIITLDMKEKEELWLELCRVVQRKLIDVVQGKQLVVEVNPSSNRLVGPMAGLEQHHVFQMTLDEEERLFRRFPVTINTDDPGVFNTSLAHEYYLIGEILLRHGRPESEVVEWLEWLRQNGRDYSFLSALPGPDHPTVGRLLKNLREKSPVLRQHVLGQDPLRAFWQRRRDREADTDSRPRPRNKLPADHSDEGPGVSAR